MTTGTVPTPIDPADQSTSVVLVPVVTSVVFDVGSQAGGDVVTISGERLISGAAVSFGPVPALSVTVKNSTTIVATSPAGWGTVEITIDTRKGAKVLNPPIDQYMDTATGP